MIVKDTETQEYLAVQCDACETRSPPAAEVLKNHGLVHMGWYCSGGVHYCPVHFDMGQPGERKERKL